jgi:hypothetical protein
MAMTRGAGGSAHHVVLLWPVPILFAAGILGQWRSRIALGAVGSAMVCMNLLVLNQYFFQLARNGAPGSFTDAIFPLSEHLASEPSRRLYVLDWGFSDSLTFLNQGRLRMADAASPLTGEADAERISGLEEMLGDPQGWFVGHVPERQFYPLPSQRLARIAEQRGYGKQLLKLIADSNGRPVFEVFRYAKP